VALECVTGNSGCSRLAGVRSQSLWAHPCWVLEKNGRRFEADGARAEAPVILYAACRCQEVSDVKYGAAGWKTNILAAGAECNEALVPLNGSLMLSHPCFRCFANVSEKAAAREPRVSPATL